MNYYEERETSSNTLYRGNCTEAGRFVQIPGKSGELMWKIRCGNTSEIRKGEGELRKHEEGVDEYKPRHTAKIETAEM